MKKKILIGSMLAVLLMLSTPFVSTLQARSTTPTGTSSVQEPDSSISIQPLIILDSNTVSPEEVVKKARNAVTTLSQDSRFFDLVPTIEREVLPYIEKTTQLNEPGDCLLLAILIAELAYFTAISSWLCLTVGPLPEISPCDVAALYGSVLIIYVALWRKECGSRSDPTQTTIDSAIKGSIAELNNAIEVTNAVVVTDDCGCGQIQSTPLHSNIIK